MKLNDDLKNLNEDGSSLDAATTKFVSDTIKDKIRKDIIDRLPKSNGNDFSDLTDSACDDILIIKSKSFFEKGFSISNCDCDNRLNFNIPGKNCDNTINRPMPMPTIPSRPIRPTDPVDYFQDSKNLMISDPATESISGLALTQQQVNQEINFQLFIALNQWLQNNFDLITNIPEKIKTKFTNAYKTNYEKKQIVTSFQLDSSNTTKMLNLDKLTDFDFLEIDMLNQNNEKSVWIDSVEIGTKLRHLNVKNSTDNYLINASYQQTSDTSLTFKGLIYRTDALPVTISIYGIKIGKYIGLEIGDGTSKNPIFDRLPDKVVIEAKIKQFKLIHPSATLPGLIALIPEAKKEQIKTIINNHKPVKDLTDNKKPSVTDITEKLFILEEQAALYEQKAIDLKNEAKSISNLSLKLENEAK